jgi:large subunit ribosomal protein L19
MEKAINQKIKPGSRVRVWEKIKEGDKERQSSFSGIVIARKHGNEAGATFTVRSVIREIGVEKIYPIHSPVITKVEILGSPKKVHRAKLYYLRKLSSKKAAEKLKV